MNQNRYELELVVNMEITHKWVIIDAASQPASLPACQPPCICYYYYYYYYYWADVWTTLGSIWDDFGITLG